MSKRKRYLFGLGSGLVFSARCNIYISRLYDASVRLSVRLSVTEVHWRIIANLGRVPAAVQFARHTGRAGPRNKQWSPIWRIVYIDEVSLHY